MLRMSFFSLLCKAGLLVVPVRILSAFFTRYMLYIPAPLAKTISISATIPSLTSGLAFRIFFVLMKKPSVKRKRAATIAKNPLREPE